MHPINFKEEMKVRDLELLTVGEGTVVLVDEENDLIEVEFDDVNEIVEYTLKSANKFLEVL